MSALEALQSCLAAEHAAMFAYGELGGVIAGAAPGTADQVEADSAYAAHRDLRTLLTALIAELSEEPVAAEAAYSTPFPVSDLASARRLARVVEERSARIYADAVAETVGAERAVASNALTACALRLAAWGGPVSPLPGVE